MSPAACLMGVDVDTVTTSVVITWATVRRRNGSSGPAFRSGASTCGPVPGSGALIEPNPMFEGVQRAAGPEVVGGQGDKAWRQLVCGDQVQRRPGSPGEVYGGDECQVRILPSRRSRAGSCATACPLPVPHSL